MKRRFSDSEIATALWAGFCDGLSDRFAGLFAAFALGFTALTMAGGYNGTAPQSNAVLIQNTADNASYNLCLVESTVGLYSACQYSSRVTLNPLNGNFATVGTMTTGAAIVSSVTAASATFTGNVIAATETVTGALNVGSCTGCGGGGGVGLQTLTVTEAAGALTIAIPSQTLVFRSANLGSGAVSSVTAAPVNFTIPQGATLGTVNGVSGVIAVVETLPSSGVPMIAVINSQSGVGLDESGLINTVAISGVASNPSVFYAAAAQTNVPYRVIGYFQSNQATAGNWVTPPFAIQGTGGQAWAAQGSIGYGQQFYNNTSLGRSANVTYFNTTNRPYTWCYVGITTAPQILINNFSLPSATAGAAACFIIPIGGNYSVTNTTIGSWLELK
jgi:hypothetical protein